MAYRFIRGLNCVSEVAAAKVSPESPAKNDEFLILVILIILLAASPSLGLNSSYFFVIIMAVIGLGGINKAFGLNVGTAISN